MRTLHTKLLIMLVAMTLTLTACGGGSGGSDDKGGPGGSSDNGSSGDTDGDNGGGDNDGDDNGDGGSDGGGSGPVTPTENYNPNGPAGVNAPEDRDSSGAGAYLTLFSFGVDTDHQEFENLVVANEYGVTGSNDAPFVPSEDISGVGTYYAGLAVGKNVGIAPAASLNNVRVFSDPTDRSVGNTREAVAYAVENLWTDVLLLGYEPSQNTDNAELKLELPTAATENDWAVVISGRDVPDTYPTPGTFGFALYADDPEYGGRMIVVGATGGESDLLDNSPTAYTPSSYQDEIGGHFIVAPGQAICSSGVPGGTSAAESVCETGNVDGNESVESSYFNSTGSGPATALVAGAATSVRGLYPSLDAPTTVRVLLCSADDLGEPGYDQKFGAGRLNVQTAIELGQVVADGGDFGECDVPPETPAINNGDDDDSNDSSDLPFAMASQFSEMSSVQTNPKPAGKGVSGCTAYIRDNSNLLQFRDHRGGYSFSEDGCLPALY